MDKEIIISPNIPQVKPVIGKGRANIIKVKKNISTSPSDKSTQNPSPITNESSLLENCSYLFKCVNKELLHPLKIVSQKRQPLGPRLLETQLLVP